MPDVIQIEAIEFGKADDEWLIGCTVSYEDFIIIQDEMLSIGNVEFFFSIFFEQHAYLLSSRYVVLSARITDTQEAC